MSKESTFIADANIKKINATAAALWPAFRNLQDVRPMH